MTDTNNKFAAVRMQGTSCFCLLPADREHVWAAGVELHCTSLHCSPWRCSPDRCLQCRSSGARWNHLWSSRHTAYFTLLLVHGSGQPEQPFWEPSRLWGTTDNTCLSRMHSHWL